MSGPTSHTMSMHLYAMGLFVYGAIMLQRLMLLWLLALVPTLCHLLTNGHARPEDYVQFLADHSNKKTRKRLVAMLAEFFTFSQSCSLRALTPCIERHGSQTVSCEVHIELFGQPDLAQRNGLTVP